MRLALAALFLAITGASAMATTLMLRDDFSSARVIDRQGQILISAKMSASGQAKMATASDEVTIDIAGDRRTLKLRVPIAGDDIEMGPYSREVANRIVYEINRRL